jgi:isopentenyldiphosphate isomerase
MAEGGGRHPGLTTGTLSLTSGLGTEVAVLFENRAPSARSLRMQVQDESERAREGEREQAQDERELFDLYDRAGAPLGRAKPRGEVHRDGDWHRSLHVWVWGNLDGAPWLVFQRRSAGKDTWPGAIDVAVTGHLRAGESIAGALREADEEIGLSLGPADVWRLGLRRRPDTRRPGVIDNELQEIFAAVGPAALEALRPSPAEVEAVVLLPFEAAGAALRGEQSEAIGLRLVSGAGGGAARFVEERIAGADFVPAPDGYYRAAHVSVGVLLTGGRPVAWEIG